MRAHQIKAVRGYKAPRRIAGRPSIIAPNRLQRQFTVAHPDHAWVTDITYLRTWQGWLYLAAVIDLHSRKVVGWSMKPTLARELAIDALMMAVLRRKPKQAVIVHSDQGYQSRGLRTGRGVRLRSVVNSWAVHSTVVTSFRFKTLARRNVHAA